MVKTPFSGIEPTCDLCGGNAQGGVAVQDGIRIWSSATWRSKSRALNRLSSSFTQCIVVSARLRRWYPCHRRDKARPKGFDALRASLRATAPAVIALHGGRLPMCGMTATTPRSANRAKVPHIRGREKLLRGSGNRVYDRLADRNRHATNLVRSRAASQAPLKYLLF